MMYDIHIIYYMYLYIIYYITLNIILHYIVPYVLYVYYDTLASNRKELNQSHYRPEVRREFQEVKVPRLRDNGTGWW